MTSPDDPLRRHLEQWLAAYGPDLAIALPEVRARPRVRAPATDPTPSPAGPDPDRGARASAAGTSPEPKTPPASPPAAPTEPVPTKPASSEPAPTGPAPTDELPETAALRELRREVLSCTRCKLCKSRQYVVFGEGNHRARVMFVGEAPGVQEDQSGRPFVGNAGQLLDRIIEGAMGLRRSDVYIANLNKCHPPGNRDPEPDEVAACLPFLKRQVEIIAPEVIVCLGRVAGQNLLGSTESTTALRRRQHEYCGIPVIVTWHPAFLLRQPARKRDTWEDIKRVLRLLGLPEVPANRK